MTRLKLRLADGSEIDATVEGAIDSGLRDLLATGYAGNQMVLAGDATEDVEGHGIGVTVNVRLYDEDDTEGQAMTLRLPNAEAARDLQRKLIAAGAAGIIVIGAATTAVVLSSGSESATTGAPAEAVAAPAPAPWYADPAVRDRGAEDTVAPATTTQPLPAPWTADPAVRDRGAEDTVAPATMTQPLPAPWTADPAVRDRGGDAQISSESGSQSAPGESRLR